MTYVVSLCFYCSKGSLGILSYSGYLTSEGITDGFAIGNSGYFYWGNGDGLNNVVSFYFCAKILSLMSFNYSGYFPY